MCMTMCELGGHLRLTMTQVPKFSKILFIVEVKSRRNHQKDALENSCSTPMLTPFRKYL